MSPTPEDLTILKDDMIAFIEGHGMSRFHGYVDYDEVQCVMWEMGNNPDGWKDFVELAKSAGAPFLTMHSWKLEREELDELVERLAHSEFSDGDDVEDARWLRAHVGKVGFLQLGWAYQGSMFLCESSTEWYDRYQRLLEVSEGLRRHSHRRTGSGRRELTVRGNARWQLAADDPARVQILAVSLRDLPFALRLPIVTDDPARVPVLFIRSRVCCCAED